MSIDSSHIKVASGLEGASGYINTLAEQILTDLDQLKAKIAPIAETWTGQAQVQYQTLQTEWDTAASNLFGPHGVLGEVSRAMHLNYTNYSEAEGANVRTWTSSAGG
ncbi:WXG100 family type VII secretion target [Streptomyces catenulae]|uniref:ESAT-6-like protein n=1 Tax=Streptomyces catenulae TaxID=66875 RepID=A0ABV2YSF4_9ACTN|nr:WXG100 family type VII secretion target [Streptomyces catenulae]